MDWVLEPVTRSSLRTSDPSVTKEDQIAEKEWGNRQIQSINNGNWTTKYGEEIVRQQFASNGVDIWRPKRMDGIQPDWETNDYIIEVKSRSWTTSGTAGEKVMGVPYKYSDVPTLYNKPLLIVCIAYQEWELTNVDKMKIFGTGVSPHKRKQLELWRSMGIHFVPFSKLYKANSSMDINEYTEVGGG